eukprot:TRINITY_DN28753_c0_g1_i1.p1 TRINITY_DN28753_c0_g1~~TRINITY_DN28753_c0_g1_i1.p1  ORF type:complete len:410 (-),score=82.97 TRINITY_DN28753_c0_g1_i1:233-1462(-)
MTGGKPGGEERWGIAATDLKIEDAEGPGPGAPRDSKQTAASFASILELAVNPPPQVGWVPQKAKRDANGSPSSKAPSDWWGNPKTDEWIYNSADHMYFHLPSSSLWERREVKCGDPNVETYTFFRVDAVHLQALSMFATSLDSALVPMAWKAWVHYTNKRRRKNQPQPALAAPPMESAEDTRTSIIRTEEQGAPPVEKADATSAAAATAAAAAAAEAEATEAATAPTSPQPPAVPARSLSPPIKAEQADTLAYIPQALNVPGSEFSAEDTDPPFAADAQTKRRRTLCAPFICFRGKPKPKDPKPGLLANSGSPNPALRQAAQGAKSVVESTTSPPGPAADRNSVEVAECTETPPASASPKVSLQPPMPSVHVKRLERFLAEVRRDPQRLSSHVEKRRAEKISMAYVVGA